MVRHDYKSSQTAKSLQMSKFTLSQVALHEKAVRYGRGRSASRAGRSCLTLRSGNAVELGVSFSANLLSGPEGTFFTPEASSMRANGSVKLNCSAKKSSSRQRTSLDVTIRGPLDFMVGHQDIGDLGCCIFGESTFDFLKRQMI